MEQSSDEEMHEVDAEKNPPSLISSSKDVSFPLNTNLQQVNLCQRPINSVVKTKDYDEPLCQSLNEFEQSDSFIRDAMLEQQNIDEKRQAKRGNFF